MSVIYAPKGKAAEYGKWAINLYKGCDHACTYCYAPSCTFTQREEFVCSKARKGVLENIEKDLVKFKGKEVFLSFTSDCYQTKDAELGLTRECIKLLLSKNIIITVLTKGGNKSLRDFDILSESKHNKYGATLTFTNKSDSVLFEPGAAEPVERIKCLETAHNRGLKTWVSLEPVIDPKQSLELIDLTRDFVDLYKVGKWNHDQRANSIDWEKFANDAIVKLKKYKKEYYIKQDLIKYIK